LTANEASTFKLPELNLSSIKNLNELKSPQLNIFDSDGRFYQKSTRNADMRASRVEPVATIEPNRTSLSPINHSQSLLKSHRKGGYKNAESKLNIKTVKQRSVNPKEALGKNILRSMITQSVTKIKPLNAKKWQNDAS